MSVPADKSIRISTDSHYQAYYANRARHETTAYVQVRWPRSIVRGHVCDVKELS
jgi:hypothetical protein